MKMRLDGRWMLACAGIIVAVTVVAAILVMGAPGEQRLRRLDEQRVQHLMQIERGVRLAHQREKRLPPDLARLDGDDAMGLQLKDPEDGSAYTYAPLDAETFDLCARFATSTADGRQRGGIGDLQWRHPKGRHCFKFRIETDGK